jgi:hypothetical protein
MSDSSPSYSPGLIPGSRQGRWKLVSEATSDEIEAAIAWDEEQARKGGEHEALHWKRWLGLHFVWVRARARELR